MAVQRAGDHQPEPSSRWQDRLPSILIRIRLFLSSYSPLFLIAVVRFDIVWLQVTCGVLAGIGAVTGWLVIHAHGQLARQPLNVTRTEDRGADVAGYLATYLLPFVTVAQPSARDLVAYGTFLLVSCVVYVRSNMVQINPTLYVFGWTVRIAEVEQGWSVFLLTRRGFIPRGLVSAARLDYNVYVQYD